MTERDHVQRYIRAVDPPPGSSWIDLACGSPFPPPCHWAVQAGRRSRRAWRRTAWNRPTPRTRWYGEEHLIRWTRRLLAARPDFGG